MNNETKRDYPFPNSSSTPMDTISIRKICDDPSDPNYFKENIMTQRDDSIKFPINQPGIPLTEFAERLIALEQENENLKIVIALIFAIASRYKDKLAEPAAWTTITNFVHDKGIPCVAFDLNEGDMNYRYIDKEDDVCTQSDTNMSST